MEEMLFERLHREFLAYSEKDGATYLETMRIRMALAGDASFMKDASVCVLVRLADEEVLNPADKYFLHHILVLIMGPDRIARDLSGASRKRGAGKRGSEGFRIAVDVLRAINKNSSSVESAWAYVAERRHLSESMVKKHWISWKGDLMKIVDRGEDNTHE